MAKRRREGSLSSTPEQDSDEARASLCAQSIEPDTHTPKYSSLVETSAAVSIRCLLPPHSPVGFETYDDYERHYEQSHANRCLDCQSNFPSSHFLNLHIAENHDPIEATKRQAGDKTFRCFVEGCDKVCQDWRKRRSHLVDKHRYPRNYDFFIVNSGIDGRRSMLRPGVDTDGHRRSSRERARRTSTDGPPSPDIQDHQEPQLREDGPPSDTQTSSDARTETSVDDLASTLSACNMIPRSVMFGRRKGLSGFASK